MEKHDCVSSQDLRGAEIVQPLSLRSSCLKFFIEKELESDKQFVGQLPYPLKEELPVLQEMKNSRWTVSKVAAGAVDLDGQPLPSNSYDIAIIKLKPPCIGDTIHMREYECMDERMWKFTRMGKAQFGNYCETSIITWDHYSHPPIVTTHHLKHSHDDRAYFIDGKLTREKMACWHHTCLICDKLLTWKWFIETLESWTIENGNLVYTYKKIHHWPSEVKLINPDCKDMVIHFRAEAIKT